MENLGSTGTRKVTIRAHRKVAPYKRVVPSCAGTIALSDTNTWLRTGTPVVATLSTSLQSSFIGWSGIASGTATTVNTTVSDAVPEYTATFNTINEPLTLSSVFPSVIGSDQTTIDFTLRGTGFTPSSQIYLVGLSLPGVTYVDSKTLKISVPRNSFAVSGAQFGLLSVGNQLSTSCRAVSNDFKIDYLPAGRSVGVELTEYYFAALDYYFVTGRAGDKALLDSAAGWARTGASIRLFNAPNRFTQPLERHFFAKVAKGGTRGSHFYTSVPAESILLRDQNLTNLPLDQKPYLESIEGHVIPKESNGSCPSGTKPIYRTFKGAPRYLDDGNHRYSSSLTQHQDMVNRLGWADEGIAFCGL